MLPGIHDNKKEQIKSLEWLREQGMDSNCVEMLSTHDDDVKPHTVEV